MALLISSRHDPYSMRCHCTGEMVNNSRDEGLSISQRYGPRGRTAPLSEIECPSLTNSVANIRRPFVAFCFPSLLLSSRLYLGSSTDFLFSVFSILIELSLIRHPLRPRHFSCCPLTAACITTPIPLITRSITVLLFIPSFYSTLHFTSKMPAVTDSQTRGRLAGKNAIITGAAGGIGLETSILFAKEGASVLLSDISQPALEKAAAKVKQLVPNAPRVEIFKCDVSKEAEVKAMVETLDSWGGIDVMFNNAGIMHAQDDDAVNTPENIWDLTHNINVKGVWFGCKHAVLSLRRHQKTKASIINTASVVALVGAATPQLAYTASKGAVLALTRELAMVHAREGYRFNNLCPAPLNTPLLQDWLGDDKEKRHRREVHFPMGRFGEAVEQAHAVVFLASDESSFVNGHDFAVDGGMTKAYVTAEGPAAPPPQNNALKDSL
ncbi:hypothetical protein LCI18_011490 [Fusarium solani-melongenae]|nr:hypothetical protein LCI18_011490 [Fusarium solani-melongenae]